MYTPYVVKESSVELKTLAKMALNGLWVRAFVGILIYQICVTGLPIIVTSLFPKLNYTITDPQSGMTISLSIFQYAYQILFIGPFLIGLNRYVLHIIRTRTVETKLIFSGFEIFFRALFLRLLIGLFVTLWTIPFALLSSFLVTINRNFYYIAMGFMVGIAVWAYIRYAMASFIMADNPTISPWQAIKQSKERMKPNLMNYFFLIVSFAGWFLLSLMPSTIAMTAFNTAPTQVLGIMRIIFEIPACFLTLYLTTTEGFFYEILVGNLRKEPRQVSPQVNWN